MSLRGNFAKIALIIIVAASVAGSFWFYKKITSPKIIYPTIRVVVPEGYTALQIDDLLYEKKIIIDKGSIAAFDIDLIKSDFWFLKDARGIEGFLFPDTYEFYLGSTPEVVVRRFLKNFEAKATTLFFKRDEVYRKLILASLIEKEVKDDGNDRRLIASLIDKRDKAGMYLGIDAALCYAKDRRGCGREGVLSQDKKINSPYNTYRNKGFPPTPIANPGRSAIAAALSPISSPYWYYLSDPNTGRTVFSRTLDEHSDNIVKYLR